MKENIPFFFWLLLAAALTVGLLLLLSWLAPRLGLMDQPSARKIHSAPVPMTGGIAIFLVVAGMSALLYRQLPVFIWPLLVAALVLVLVGVLDDRWELAPGWRFVAQAVAIAAVIGLTGVRIDSFGFLLSDQWPLTLGVLAVPLTLFGIIGIINAINMADGIDGLAATLVLIPLLLLGLVVPDAAWRRWFAVVGVAIGVFLLFNLFGGRRRVFLGDAGSLLLGFILAWLVVYFSQGSHRVIFPVTALWLLALPVFDTIFVMTQRLLAGRSPFSPDRRHLHHLLMRLGYSAGKTLLLIAVYALILAQVGWLMLHYGVPEHIQFAAFVGLSLVYYFSVRRLWHKLDKAAVATATPAGPDASPERVAGGYRASLQSQQPPAER
jgi:UDP-GlcNAc:undecaprenyl-phosphate GlcNAc-1-phosphate transferase